MALTLEHTCLLEYFNSIGHLQSVSAKQWLVLAVSDLFCVQYDPSERGELSQQVTAVH